MADPLVLKAAFSSIAVILTFAAFYPYLSGILRGTTRPHVFSWVVWAFGTIVVFGAQLSVGAWPIGLSGC